MTRYKNLLAALLAAVLALSTACSGEEDLPADVPVQPEPPIQEEIAPPEPEPIVKTAAAAIAATGDILMHQPVIKTGRVGEGGTYDFSSIFPYFAPYVARADLAAANLETTLCGTDNGFPYQGYPRFNCPDGIVDSLKTAGFDLLLTANNHAYDTGETGFFRTLRTIDDRGLLRIGTHLTDEEDRYIIQDLNGIRVGLLCYTYETQDSDPGIRSLNCILMNEKTSPLVNTFDDTRLEEFYTELEGQLSAMKEAGAEATVIFLHWGYEYHTRENEDQRAMAQRICDLGVDVIIGGHPHVVQPVELLTSQTDPEHKTVCLYSMGNAVSNQRRERLPSYDGYTEDGVLFQVTFAKYSDGTVLLDSAELLPTWVNLTTGEEWGKRAYEIIPLDPDVTDWKSAFTLTDGEYAQAQASYERTTAIVGEGMEAVDRWLDSRPTPDQNETRRTIP